ncbi:MAG: DUF1566 domain-containing protein [Bacteroidales bacterium]|nr:DUF1566 domain-containing protein [Bacteroidales bacterium]
MAAILLGFGLHSCDREDNNGDNNGGNNGGGGSGSDTTSLSLTWVDLGLPSGLLWADRNVGASSPEDYGNYYAWGETTPKNVYDWSTYAYGNDSGGLTKYCSKASYGLNGFTDNLTVLQASDDAATANLGGGARTPTYVQWEELIDHTTSTWIIRGGVGGRLLTAANGESLFLPAAGYRDGSGLYYAGEGGYYWSSTLDTDDPDDARIFDFLSYYQDMDYSYRFSGIPVRAVRASQH